MDDRTKKTNLYNLPPLSLAVASLLARSSSLRLVAQAQEADIAERNREVQKARETMDDELQRNDKRLSDAALSGRTRDRKVINLIDQVSCAQEGQRRKQHPRHILYTNCCCAAVVVCRIDLSQQNHNVKPKQA